SLLSSLRLPAPSPTLFPYTTLFRSQRDGERGLSGGQTSGSAAARTLRAGDDRRAGRIHSPHPCRRPDRADRREIPAARLRTQGRSEEHTSELQSRVDLVCRLLLEKK